jgi:hypothetical protein
MSRANFFLKLLPPEQEKPNFALRTGMFPAIKRRRATHHRLRRFSRGTGVVSSR